MKVFISWSGKISHKVAIALRDWLPSVIQAVEPFVSSEDIERGARWFTDIGSELENVNFGILCITPQNMNAPWVLFEAGALSKSMDQSRVTPLLVGVKNSDIEGPLSQFNTTSLSKDEIFKLIKTINKQLKESSLPDQAVERAFEKWWPELDALLTEAAHEANKTRETKSEPTRTQSEILEEILELTRSISRQVVKTKEREFCSDELKKYILFSRFADTPKDINYFTRNALADFFHGISDSDIKRLKGMEIKAGERWKEKIIEALIEKTKDDDTKEDDSGK